MQSLNDILAKWEPARQASAALGHDISRTTIGIDFDGTIKVSDDSGAYEYRIGLNTKTVIRTLIGCPSRATEDVCNRMGV
jgi:hypothetical protein